MVAEVGEVRQVSMAQPEEEQAEGVMSVLLQAEVVEDQKESMN